MPIPALDDGLLPPGVHQCTMQEIHDTFGTFQLSSRRCRLFEQLETFVSEIKSTGLVVAVIVDGSFVTGKPEPNDIDLILILPAQHDFSSELRPHVYNVLSRRQVRKRHGFDILIAVEGEPELVKHREFFARVRGQPRCEKGLLRVTL